MRDALAWQIELGADEAIGDSPVSRFDSAASAARERGNTGAQPSPQAAPRAAAAAPRGREGDTRETGDARPGRVFAAAQLPHPAETADSIDALAALCEACDAGDLKAGARNFCFADGRPGASLMVIGEAPGAEEDRLARPFVGRAGQLLDSMLAAIGRTREAETPDRAVYIANILPWRPAGNRTPTEAEMALFLPFVERHIALADPAVLLLLGNTPVRALLEDRRGITRTRGTWQAHGPTGIRAMPSFHPAFLLRTPSRKKEAWADLLAVSVALEEAR